MEQDDSWFFETVANPCPGKKGMMAEIFLLPISTFLPTSFIFMALSHISESLTFTKMIKHIMDEAQLTFFSHDAESPIPRPKYKCPFTFSHRVRIMRNLHPDVGKAGDSEILPTKLTKWRRQCEQAMNYNGYGTHSQFGGLFKEALSCACLSRRTYKLLDNIMTKHNDLHISFKGNMIRGISGCYDELYIFSVLRQVDDGVIGLQEMNESLIKEKKNTRECRPSPDDPDAKQELAVLRAEVAKLRRELPQKAQKVASLEEELAKRKQTGHNGEARRDIFNFESPIPGNRTCRYSRPPCICA
ncbi:hypothetical protein MAR_003233 [Mya arenaria]|uniref:Uncharacterized protein n=1 Tax=Mya arenaria TaxID=6604 RepID=A0ABY7G5E4_MYAAR|nr:hypothetical protein MAR_003233 [Mya arenaria]